MLGINEIIRRSILDFISPSVLRFVFLPIIFAFIAWTIIFYYFASDLFLYFFSFVDVSFENSFLIWLEWIVDWMGKISIFLFVFILFFILILFTNLVICSFLSPLLVRHVMMKHYPESSIKEDTSFRVTFELLKIYFVYFIALTLCAPVYFIPIAGSIVLLLINYIFFVKSILFDVGSMVLPINELKQFRQTHKKDIRNLGVFIYLLGLMPIVNFIIPFFALIAFSHLFFSRKEAYGR